jgi:hypothetical protein
MLAEWGETLRPGGVVTGAVSRELFGGFDSLTLTQSYDMEWEIMVVMRRPAT